jgi:predicted nuclease with TOPRIM domain
MSSTSTTGGNPLPSRIDETNTLLREMVRDLRTNGQDLRLVLAYMERDATRLRQDLADMVAKSAQLREELQTSSKKAQRFKERNEELEEVLDLRTDTDHPVSLSNATSSLTYSIYVLM